MDIKDLLQASSSPRLSRTAQLPRSYSPTGFSHLASTVPANLPGQGHRQQPPQLPAQPSHVSKTSQASAGQCLNLNTAATVGTERPLPISERATGTSAPNQSGWSLAEDGLIIKLRKSGISWEDISRNLPGRSAISCESHFQDCLQPWAVGNEEQRDKLLMAYLRYGREGELQSKLAGVYHRLKTDFWKRVAEELNMPWQACEDLHWAIGKHDMTRRANTAPPAHTEPNDLGCGRVAQTDRMVEPTSKGPRLTPLTSPFTSVNGGNLNRCRGHGVGHGILGYPPVGAPPIEDEQCLSNHREKRDGEVESEDTAEGPRVRQRKLPGDGVRKRKLPWDGPGARKRKLPGDGPGARKKTLPKVPKFESEPAALAGAEEKNGRIDGSGGKSLNENQTAKVWTESSLTYSKEKNTGSAATLTSDQIGEMRALDRRLREPFGLFDII